MFKRFSALLLCALMLFCLVPASAKAAVPSGWNSKVDYENDDPNRYTIEIDLKNQIITVYEGGIGGKIVLQSLCTTGDKEHTTGSGTYKLGQLKERFGYFVAFGQYAQYWSQVVRGIYIHSVMYNSQKTSSMSSSAYKKLGQNVSHGCIRVLPDVAKFIYYNCPPGTTCVITRKIPVNKELVAAIKKTIPSYKNYKQPVDNKPWPQEIPAVVRYDGTPLMTGTSPYNDTQIGTLSAGTKVRLLQLSRDWVKLKTEKGTLGYVKTDYVLADPDAPIQTVSAYAATKKTYVYAAMSTESQKLATIPSGSQVTVTENPKKGWWKGSFNGVEGYMRTKYVKMTEVVQYPELPQSVQSQVTQQTAAEQNGGTQAVIGGTVTAPGVMSNMRSGAGTGFAVIASFEPGTPVTIESVEGNWYKCTVNGMSGYMFNSCVVGR